jgi:WxL domain surface cell wall-binding
VSFSATLNGQDQAPTTTQALDVGDSTGSGTGWNVTATSTTFTAGSHTLPDTATSVASSPSVACDASVSCVTATTDVSYPYTLPAGATAPTASKLYNATANTGMGNQTVTPTWKLSVPASAFAGTYASTWTLSLVSGP